MESIQEGRKANRPKPQATGPRSRQQAQHPSRQNNTVKAKGHGGSEPQTRITETPASQSAPRENHTSQPHRLIKLAEKPDRGKPGTEEQNTCRAHVSAASLQPSSSDTSLQTLQRSVRASDPSEASSAAQHPYCPKRRQVGTKVHVDRPGGVSKVPNKTALWGRLYAETRVWISWIGASMGMIPCIRQKRYAGTHFHTRFLRGIYTEYAGIRG